MRKISFTKMHGDGNDFVLIDDRAETFPVHDHILLALLATPRTGIACEGVILLQKSSVADFRMVFFNPDGTEADLCGNGARCVAAFAREIGAAREAKMRFETAAGDVEAEVLDEGLVRVSMPTPRLLADDFAVVGVPHRIVPVENLAKTDVAGDGRRIRLDPAYAPDGTNVDFVVYRPPDRVDIRTYERCVEEESGACGTGAVAAAVVGVADYGLSFPVRVRTAMGYELVVDGKEEDGAFSSLSLTGPVRRVFDGEIDFDALDVVSE
jgi:diaminopimelate epimerase